MRKALLTVLLLITSIAALRAAEMAGGICGPGEKTIYNYWGFQTIANGDSCPVVCGPCEMEYMTNKLVGQTIYECDGTVSHWGLTCDRGGTISYESCPACNHEN